MCRSYFSFVSFFFFFFLLLPALYEQEKVGPGSVRKPDGFDGSPGGKGGFGKRDREEMKEVRS